MSYKIEIADSTSHKIEISSSINDQTPIIQILEGHSSDINISHDIALLPADFNENVKTIIDSFLTAGYGVSIVPSGSFLRISTSGLQPSGNYSLVGHSHVSSDITNFNSSVSGLLPVKNVVSGSGIAVSDINGTFTVAVTGQFGLTSEQVDDRVSSLLSSGYGINLNYDDNNNLLTISTIGLQPSGNYSIAGHSHVSSDITDFISVASGASPVQTVAGRLGNVVLTKNDVGLSNVDNTSDINKPVSLAQAAADIVIQNNAASDASTKANNAQAYAIQRSNHTGTQTASTISDFIAVASGAAPVQTVAGRAGNVVLNKNDVGLNNVDNTSDINKPVSIATQNALNLKSDIGHLHTSSNITNFASTVSGLLPVKNILSGSGISVTSVGSDFTVAVTGQFGLTGEQVDDRVSNLLVAGNYVNLNYNDSNDSLMISVTGVQPSGDYAAATHDHISAQITDFNTSVSGLLPVVNISAGSNIVISNVGGNFIVGATGLQPSGNYSVAGHSHLSSDITNFNTSVSGLLTPYATINSPSFSGTPTAPTASSGTNNSQIANTQFVRTEISNLVNAAPSTLDTLNELATALGNDPNFATTITNNLAGKANLTGATFSGAVGGPSGDFGVLKQSGVVVSVSGHTHSYSDITNFASGVSDNLTTALLAGSFINLYYNSSQDTLTISASGLQPSGNYSVVDHTHTSSNITDFNSSVSGLLPTVANSGTNRLLTSTGSNVGVSAQANLTFNGSLLNVTGSGVFSSGLNIANQTASTIASFDNNKNVVSLSTSTYPSLTELAYVKGVTSSLQTQLDLKSNLNSPSFTGTPTAPTAASGTNTNQIASTSFVRNEISNLVASAPSTLDTLNELATALGNDPNFATTVTNNLAGKANISGATFTGYVAAPSGNFTVLQQNGTNVSVSGHVHNASEVTTGTFDLTRIPFPITYPIRAIHVGGVLSFNNWARTASPTYFWGGSAGDMRTLAILEFPATSVSVSVSDSVTKYINDNPGMSLTYASLEVALIDAANRVVGWGTTATSSANQPSNGTAGTSMTIPLLSFPVLNSAWFLGGNSTYTGLNIADIMPITAYKFCQSRYLDIEKTDWDNIPNKPVFSPISISGSANDLLTGTVPFARLPVGTSNTTVAIGNDSRLSDAREWSASTIDQTEAETGTSTTRRAFTAQRIFQAIAAWWSASSAKTKLDGISAGATVNSTDAQLRDRSTHTGTQTANTISDFTTAVVAAAPVQTVAGRTGTVTLSSSDITNFNSSVSGLLPITNILSGSNILISQSGTTYTVGATGSLGLSTEEVDDRVASLLVAGSGINLSYNDNANSLTISSIKDIILSDVVASTNYIGSAPNGSSTSDNVWTINRTIYTSAGSVSSTGVAINVSWNNRTSIVYL